MQHPLECRNIVATYVRASPITTGKQQTHDQLTSMYTISQLHSLRV